MRLQDTHMEYMVQSDCIIYQWSPLTPAAPGKGFVDTTTQSFISKETFLNAQSDSVWV